jgi:hypothetical protein
MDRLFKALQQLKNFEPTRSVSELIVIVCKDLGKEEISPETIMLYATDDELAQIIESYLEKETMKKLLNEEFVKFNFDEKLRMLVGN